MKSTNTFANNLRPAVGQKVALRATRQSKLDILDDKVSEKENATNGQDTLSSTRGTSRLRRPLAAIKILESNNSGNLYYLTEWHPLKSNS